MPENVHSRFDAFVARVIEKDEARRTAADARVAFYLRAVEDLYLTVEQSLRTHLQPGFTILFDQVEITETDTSPYAARRMSVRSGGVTIEFDPAGSDIVGGLGRIDVSWPNGRLFLALMEGMRPGRSDWPRPKWLATSAVGAAASFYELTEDALLDMVEAAQSEFFVEGW